MRQIAIIGGGISGLSAGHAIERLTRAAGIAAQVTILEKEERTGGKVWSLHEDGFLCEWGPNGFLDSKPMTLELCAHLGISERLLRSDDNARKRFIYATGQLHSLPENGPSFLKSQLISWPGKMRLAAELLIPPRRDGVDETLAAFARRRLGPEALDKLIGPMVSGIFAGDPETMSLKSCFPRICELEQQYGGLLKAMILLAKKKKAEIKAGKAVASAAGPAGILTSFVGGIQDLTNATAAALSGPVRINTTVTAIRRQSDGFELTLADGSSVNSEIVIFAAPAHALAEMTDNFDAEMARILREILYAPMNVICCGYEREKISRNLDAFGYLIAKKERRATLGTLWDSSIFPNRAPQGKVLLRSMMGGATNPAAIDLSDSAVLSKVRADLQQIMGISAEPDFVRIFRHPQAIPQYTVGHSRRIEGLRARAALTPGLFLTGNAFFGVGLNDCVNASNQVADAVLSHLQK